MEGPGPEAPPLRETLERRLKEYEANHARLVQKLMELNRQRESLISTTTTLSGQIFELRDLLKNHVPK